jgi:hypothetical protein
MSEFLCVTPTESIVKIIYIYIYIYMYIYIARDSVMDAEICSIGGMILPQKDRSTPRKTCLNVTSSSINAIRNDLLTNSGLSDEEPKTSRLSHNKNLISPKGVNSYVTK